MITGMDRLNAAAKGEKSDRIPVFCSLFDQGQKELGISSEKYFSNGEYIAQAQLKIREKYGHDNLWSLFYVGREAELLGCKKILFSEQGPPNVADFIIKNHEDIHRLQIPEDISLIPAFEQELKCLKILTQEAGGKYPICAYLTASMTLPALLMGMDKWMELLFLGPRDVRDELLEKCSDFFKKHWKACKKAGADIFVYANAFGSTDTVPMKFFKEHSLGWMEKDLENIDKTGLVYYCGSSRLNNVIDIVIEKLGISTLYLSPFDDVAQGKKIVAGRGVTCGVINDIPMIDSSENEIKQEVKRIISAGIKGGKFAFGTIGIPYNTPERNIFAMVEAACKYGGYEYWKK
ncbi:Uroporphyrinogen decarboxylase [Desulfonema limicola]|uniref:Uroporphyrinogen decarboxylase n=1 Tax=Desulfonema limicola TaxID=45656 RepID=A0A975B8P9_9BACT|nr:uroporphyrinogen decarboxylase family protein [Desulfonema limicola]QTA80830.1 Uroporphyrinogen decarboxylase [Desulfonema limicola]